MSKKRQTNVITKVTIELTPEQRAALCQQLIAALLPRAIEIIREKRRLAASIEKPEPDNLIAHAPPEKE